MRVLIVLCATLCTACANPYAQFYQGQADARILPFYLPSDEKIEVFSSNDLERDVRSLMRKGYAVIGSSSFNGAENSGKKSNLLSQAETIGAHVVLISSEYTNTISGAVPLVVPNNSTSHSSGTATAYGSGGSATAYGSSTTTTYGSETVMLPTQTRRYDFQAVYLARVRSRAGIIVTPLDDEARRRLQSNKGVVVDLVVEGTPAFLADVIPGDILLSVGDVAIYSRETYVQALDKYQGSTPDFTIVRGDQTLHKKIEIISYPQSSESK
jgi:hypothetical protein